MSLIALLLAAAPTSATRGTTAEEAMANYRKVMKPVRELDCPRSAGEIIVCGRTGGQADPERLPLPVEREPGDHIPGEPLADGGGCIRLCSQPVMVPLHKAPAFIRKIIERLKDD